MEIKVYTREPNAVDYPAGLAYSVHMASREGEEEFRPWHKNYGILFAQAQIRPDDTLDTKAVKHPRIFGLEDGSYGIAAVRVQENGEEDVDSKGKVLLWKTRDFISFDSLGLVDLLESGWESAGDCISARKDVLERAQNTGGLFATQRSGCLHVSSWIPEKTWIGSEPKQSIRTVPATRRESCGTERGLILHRAAVTRWKAASWTRAFLFRWL